MAQFKPIAPGPTAPPSHDTSLLEYGSLGQQVGFHLRLAQLAIFNDQIAMLKPFTLRPVDLSVLSLVAENPGVIQQTVGDALRIQRPNLVAVIDALQARGLISRTASPRDRRSNCLNLTEAGHDMLEATGYAQNLHAQRIADRLVGVDMGNFLEGLRRLGGLEG